MAGRNEVSVMVCGCGIGRGGWERSPWLPRRPLCRGRCSRRRDQGREVASLPWLVASARKWWWAGEYLKI